MGTPITSLPTELLEGAIDDLLAVVDDVSGTPETTKMEIGNLLSVDLGQIYVSGGAGTQTPGVSYVKITQFDSNGLFYRGVTPDHTNDILTLDNTGIYLVAWQVSFTGSNASIVDITVFWNGVEQSQCHAQRKLGTGSDVGSMSAIGLVDVTTGSTDIDLRVKCDGAPDAFDLVNGQLVVIRIAKT